jgi:hypothetical protein
MMPCRALGPSACKARRPCAPLTRAPSPCPAALSRRLARLAGEPLLRRRRLCPLCAGGLRRRGHAGGCGQLEPRPLRLRGGPRR